MCWWDWSSDILEGVEEASHISITYCVHIRIYIVLSSMLSMGHKSTHIWSTESALQHANSSETPLPYQLVFINAFSVQCHQRMISRISFASFKLQWDFFALSTGFYQCLFSSTAPENDQQNQLCSIQIAVRLLCSVNWFLSMSFLFKPIREWSAESALQHVNNRVIDRVNDRVIDRIIDRVTVRLRGIVRNRDIAFALPTSFYQLVFVNFFCF